MDTNIGLFRSVMDILLLMFFFLGVEENFSNFTAKSKVFFVCE